MYYDHAWPKDDSAISQLALIIEHCCDTYLYLLAVQSLQSLSAVLSVEPVVVVLSLGPEEVVKGNWNEDVESLRLNSSEGVEKCGVHGTLQWLLGLVRNSVSVDVLLFRATYFLIVKTPLPYPSPYLYTYQVNPTIPCIRVVLEQSFFRFV